MQQPPEVLDALAREMLTPTPAPYVAAETQEAKRRRLAELDRALNADRNRRPTTEGDRLSYVAGLGGRICDLPGYFLDMLTRRVALTPEVKEAQRQINATAAARAQGWQP